MSSDQISLATIKASDYRHEESDSFCKTRAGWRSEERVELNENVVQRADLYPGEKAAKMMGTGCAASIHNQVSESR